ncbi:hypothetical protein HII17_09140 [Thalassotalea sp. M1531]|uniref:SdiA-regulated family protein n=1 Tax=Thalassotalea algicola TaxID=2716224 RepID=A0A7Y0LDN5_9GAMM|nr:hypothetical protein [Thalassotalea algicola]
MKTKIATTFALLLVIVFCFIGFRVYKLYHNKITSIAPEVNEISGAEFDKHGNFWAINDGGDGPLLYHLNRQGEIVRTIEITNALNKDWEDMTQNSFGHFFIGDFGNNSRQRTWLTVYKIENPIDIKTATTTAEIIKFKYPILPDAIHPESNGNHDVEAFVYYQNSLYLFTKNRTKPFDGKTHLFRIGDHADNYEAKYISSFVTCTYIKELCWITSAALSPDRKKLALLDHRTIWLFEQWQGNDFFSGKVRKIDLGVITQKESLTFVDNNTLVFTDEAFKGIGGNAYLISLDEQSATDKIDAVKQD